MSDDKMKVDIGLEVHSTGEELIDALTRKLDALNRKIRSINTAANAVAKAVSTPGGTKPPAKGTNDSKSTRDATALDRQAVSSFRQRMTIASRMASQRQREERAAFADYRARMSLKAKSDAADMRAVRDKAQEEAKTFRQRMSFTSRMGRLAIAEERRVASERSRSIADAARQEARRSRDVAASIRANARLEASEARRVDRERSTRESARSRGFSSMRQGAGDVREGAGRVVRGAGAMSAVAAAGTGAAVRRGVSTRMEVDTAETNLKIFSGQSAEQIRQARKGFLDNEAIKNGLGIAGGLDAYSEVLKAGIGSPEKVVSTIMKGVAGLELNLKETTKLAGLIDRNYGAASDPNKIKSVLNAVAVAAREDPTQSNEIIEGVKRGFGALSTGNMTPEQLTALVSGGQSVGIQPGKAGTFVATQAKRMSEGASKFLGKKERKELDYAARELGYGNARSMAQAYAKQSYAEIMNVNEKLAAMAPDKRAQVADALYGRQWSDEGLQMSQGVEGVKKTYGEITDGKNANFLDEAARQRAQSLQGQWNSTKSIFGRFWDAFGSGFEDILTSINGYFLNINSKFDYDKVKSYVVSFMDGIKDALGVKTWTELLQSMFGGNLGNAGPQIREFARGLTEGVLTIVRAIRSVMTAFTGSNATAAEMGKWAGEFIALSAALLVAAPAISVMTGIGVALTGLATVALGAWRILRAAGLVGATGVGSTPKIPVVPGQGAGGLGRLLGIGGAAAGVAGSGLTKGDQDALTRKLGDWAKDREKPVTPPSTPWIDPPARTAVEKLKEAVEANTLIHRQSYESENNVSGLIHKASLSTASPAQGVRANIEAMGGRISNASVGSVSSPLSSSTAGGGFGPSPLAGSTPGSALGSGGGRLSSRGIIGGVGSSSLPSSGATGAYKPVLDFIAGTEGTAGHGDYNASLGYGKFLPGGKETNLTGKTLDQIDALQSGMLSHPQNGFNSSAIGRYQIVRKTLRGLRSKLGLKGTDLYDESMQDRLGAELVRQRGANAGGLGQEWASLRGGKAQQAAALVGQIPSSASTNPGPRPIATVMSGVGSGVAASVSDNASKLIGMGSSQAAQALGSRMTPGQWCADFVNGSLKSANIKGVNSSIATSFLGWGKEVTDGIRKGDVLVESRGRGIGQPGGHAGIATGETRQGPRGLQAEMVSGNHGNRVARSWTDMSKLTARRAITGGTEDLAAGIKANSWKPGAGGNAGALGSSSSAPLGENTPPRAINTISQNALSGGGAGGGSSVHAPITIQGAGMDHEAIANAVQRKLNEKMNRRTNDISPSSLSV